MSRQADWALGASLSGGYLRGGRPCSDARGCARHERPVPFNVTGLVRPIEASQLGMIKGSGAAGAAGRSGGCELALTANKPPVSQTARDAVNVSEARDSGHLRCYLGGPGANDRSGRLGSTHC